MGTTVTEWELRLKENVSNSFKHLINYAGGAQKKVVDVSNSMAKAAQASNSMGRDFKRNYVSLENTLAGLEVRQKSAFTTKHILAYEQLIQRTKSEMQKLNDVTKPSPETLSRWGMFKNNLSTTAGEIPGLSKGMQMLENPMFLAGSGALALGYGLKKAGELAFNYETGMAKINATAQLSTGNLEKLENRLIDIGSHSGGNFELIPDAYEKILSQTGKVNMSLDILETAVKGAKAGFTDIDTLSSAVAQSLSSIGAENAAASDVLDTFMMAKKVGAGEFKDFAQYLPQLIASGKNLAISYKDTAGMFAYMTGKGQSAADSAMLMNNAFTALQKDPVIKGLEKKGVLLFNKAGARRNINDVFQDLSAKLDGFTDRQKSKFFIDIGLNDAQARTAFSVMTDEAKKLKDTMNDVNHAMGETDRQLEATANDARTWGDLGDEIKGWGVNIGKYVLPVAREFVDLISHAAHGWKDIFTGDMFKDQGAYDKALAERQDWLMHQAWDQSNALAKQRFGDKLDIQNHPDQRKFRDEYYDKVMGLFEKKSKNTIDLKESPAQKALDNINKGKSARDTNTDVSTSNSSSVTTDSGKIRTLIQTLNITNKFEVDHDANLEKVKQKVTDIFVDAGRDAVVTLGV